MNTKPLIENAFWQKEEECMPRDELRALQLQKLRSLVARVYASVPAYTEALDKAGVKPDDNSVVYFAGIDNARFKRPVVPGDQLIFDVEITHAKRNIYKYKARASVDGELAAEAELMCAIKTL